MLSITVLLYSLTRRLFNERIALCAAVLFSVSESAIFLGNFATYDATCLFLLACAAWIVVRTAGFRWPVFLMAAPVAALAVGVKYAGLCACPASPSCPCWRAGHSGAAGSCSTLLLSSPQRRACSTGR